MKKVFSIVKKIVSFLLALFCVFALAFLYFDRVEKDHQAPARTARSRITGMRQLMIMEFSFGMEDGKSPSQAFLAAAEKITDAYREKAPSLRPGWGDHRFFVNADLRTWQKAYEHFEANEEEQIPEEIALFAFSPETGEYQYVTFAGEFGHGDHISFRNIKEIK